MGCEENKRIVKVILENLFCETAYRYYGNNSSFEGHMIDYQISPLHGEENARLSREGKAPHQTHGLRELQQLGEENMRMMYPDADCRAIKSMTAEGNRVVAEYLVHGGRTAFRDDRENNFHCVKVFELDQGQVVNIREYIDSAYLYDFAKAMTNAFGEGIRVEGRGEVAHRAAEERWAGGSSWHLNSQWFDLGQRRIHVDAAELEENKRIATAAVQAWGEEQMFDLLADHVMFTNEVDLETTPTLGRALRGKEAMLLSFARIRELFPDGLQREIRAVTAEENRVCVEDTVRGRSTVRPDDDLFMRNLKICFLRDSKIFRVRQLVDSGYCRWYSRDAIDFIFGERDALPTA